jgi:gluconokinase
MPSIPLVADLPILAVDIGTGSARAILFDASGGVLAEARSPVRTLHPRPGWAEQDPDEIVDAVAGVLRATMAEAAQFGGIAAVSFSSQMYSVLATTPAGLPLTMSIPWSDTRAAQDAEHIRTGRDARRLIGVTGCPAQPVYPLAKIRWLRANVPLPEDALFISIKDYVLWRLTGVLTADRSTASASGMLDISAGEWSELALNIAGLTPANVPSLDSPRALIHCGPSSLLRDIGLPAVTPVVLGAGDAPLSSVGCGAVAPEVLAMNIGTSAAARRMIREPRADPAGRLWTYIVDLDYWVTGGIIGSAGSAYDWALDMVLGGVTEDPYGRAEALLGSVGPGSDGLTFVPYLSGEQSPSWRPSARGAFVGIGLRHERGHLLRAVVEGLVFALQRVRLAIEDTGTGSLEEVAVTGGLCRSAATLHIIADVLGLPVVVPPGHEGSARGAAILARLALGALPDLETAGRLALADRPRILPSGEAHAIYRHRFEEFVGLADRLTVEKRGDAS